MAQTPPCSTAMEVGAAYRLKQNTVSAFIKAGSGCLMAKAYATDLLLLPDV